MHCQQGLQSWLGASDDTDAIVTATVDLFADTLLTEDIIQSDREDITSPDNLDSRIAVVRSALTRRVPHLSDAHAAEVVAIWRAAHTELIGLYRQSARSYFDFLRVAGATARYPDVHPDIFRGWALCIGTVNY